MEHRATLSSRPRQAGDASWPGACGARASDSSSDVRISGSASSSSAAPTLITHLFDVAFAGMPLSGVPKENQRGLERE